MHFYFLSTDAIKIRLLLFYIAYIKTFELSANCPLGLFVPAGGILGGDKPGALV
jgi:hypothetical protein